MNIDFNEIMFYIDLAAIYFIAYNFEIKRILEKFYKPKNISNVSKIENNVSLYHDINLSKLKLEYKKNLLIFTKKVIKNFKEDDLINFYNNINSLDIRNNNKLLEMALAGTYSSSKNKIEISGGYENCIYHELFHMASSKFENNIDYSGFEQLKKSFRLGKGINEGYTDLLTYRYFPDGFESNDAYKYAMDIMQLLEIIVGKEKMQSLYLQADLLGLITELKKYNLESKIMQFISNMDYIIEYMNLGYFKKKSTYVYKSMTLKRLIDVNQFLLDSYTKKLILSGNLSYEERQSKLNEFMLTMIYKITIEIEGYEINLEILNDNMINSCFQELDDNSYILKYKK